MKCIILLTLVALCYSYPYGSGYGKSVNINEDGTIVITEPRGKRITINKGIGSSGQKTVDITVSGPYIPTKRIQINAEDQTGARKDGDYYSSDEYLRDKRSSKDKKQRSQGDTLTKILKQYEGEIDQPTYLRLLNEIKDAVQAGHLSSSVYDVLQNLDQNPLELEGYWGRQQGITGGQNQLSGLDLLDQQSQVGVNIPVGVDEQGRQILQRVFVPRSQLATGLGSWGLSNTRGWGVGGPQGLGGISRTPWGTRGLLTGGQWGQTSAGQAGGISEPR